jgi:uncharacterized protein (TIGR03435 family)
MNFPANAQSQPPVAASNDYDKSSFDVASIRLMNEPNPATGFSFNPDDLLIKGANLRFVITLAYGLRDDQLIGKYGWIDDAKYEIAAKCIEKNPTDITPENAAHAKRDALLQARLQSLLGERFHLRVHEETRDLEVYSLVAPDQKTKLVASHGEFHVLDNHDGGYVKFEHASMKQLASMLSAILHRDVHNDTKLQGFYDFTLEWNPHELADPDSPLPPLFTAIKEQLGLQLKSARGSTRVIVIDNIEPPTPN